jgi:FKBP-type peptidyl-prolyl cis-trans isomerase
MGKGNIILRGIFFVVLFIVGFSVYSCTSEDEQTTLTTEIDAIDTYVNTFIDAGNNVTINGGSSRIVKTEGSGNVVEKGDSVYFNYAGYIFSSGLGTIFDTNIDSLSSVLGIDVYNRGFDNGKVVAGKGELVKGLDLGIIGAKEGEYSYIVFPSDLGYGNTTNGIIPKMSSLIYEIWILDIVKN